MNERLKGRLHTAWTEPRHFFFWLALLSLFASALVLANRGHAAPGVPLAVVLTAGALGFVVGLAAFILAWIPPARRLLAWLLGRRFLVLACLATLIALFYAVENWRGRHAWQSFKQEQEARGERFDLAGVIPPPVPADQNFFETPLWDDMHFVQTNGVTTWNGEGYGNRVVFSIYGPRDNGVPAGGTRYWQKGQRVDLAAWQAFYRGTNNVFAAESGPPTNYFPIASAPQSPAADVLLALSKFSGNREILITSSTRPYARFWVNYEAGPGALVPHLARMKSAAGYLSLHANAALKAGEHDTVIEDLKALFRLIEASRREPFTISHLVRIAELHIAIPPIWEGLVDRRWSDADLSVLETELGKLDFLADYQLALRGERACCELWAVDFIRKVGLEGYAELGGREESSSPGEISDSSEVGKSLGMALFRLVPAGWFDQNKLSLCRMQENYLLPIADTEQRVISPAAAARAEKAIAQLHPRPYDAFSWGLVPSLSGLAVKFAHAQATAHLSRLACALERYRLANGQFPETLEALAPKFIAKVPHDVINGQPLKYRRTDDRQFVLYSVGWNETDDGGKVELTKSGNPDEQKGDWVWRCPAG